MKKTLIIGILLTLSIHLLSAQTKIIEDLWKSQTSSSKINYQKPEYLNLDEEKISKMIDNQASFGMYHDNYFITGIPTNNELTQNSADVKYQISIRQRLTKTVLPFNSFLALTYTQKSFWDIYQKSAPFTDNNYNPGLSLAKPVVYHNQLRGMLSLSFEHESNGQADSTKNRSWNYFTASGNYFFNRCISAQVKVWAGWLSDDNSDLYKYRGFGLLAFNYRSLNDKLWISAVLNPRNCFRDMNTQLEINFKISPKSNQYLFLQWYNGYGESLLEYNQYTSMVRIGICIKPPLRNMF